MPATTNLLLGFRQELDGDTVAALQAGLVGQNARIEGPFGVKPLVYADYVASGRALMQIERFVLEEVLPYYANSHTEASFCGGFMTRLRREARAAIAACCGADGAHAVIFAGSGATAGINRLVKLLGVADAETLRPVLGHPQSEGADPGRRGGAGRGIQHLLFAAASGGVKYPAL